MSQNELVELPRPYELLELLNNQSYEVTPIKYEEGVMSITPKPPRPQIQKIINVLRVYYDKDPEVPGIDYIDITSGTLIAQLAPLIDAVIKSKLSIKITAFGEGVRKRFTAQVL